ncbi:MAG: NAD(P)-dependent oxidoreductase [Alphaproteobacteria bacterium]
MTTLVTGAGLIGTLTARHLAEQGDKVALFDVGPQREAIAATLRPYEIPVVAGDIASFSALAAAIEAYGVRRIVHTAAMLTAAIKADPPRGIGVNVIGTVNVLEAARKFALARVVLASSSTVSYPSFDSNPGAAYPVDFRMRTISERPTTFYSASKLAGEHLALIYAADFGVDVVALRYGAVIGEWAGPNRSIPGRLVRALLVPAMKGETAIIDDPLLVWQGGDDFVDARDVARANALALEAKTPAQRIYYVTFGRMHSFDDFVAATRSLYSGFKTDVRVTAKAGFAGFPKIRPATSDLRAAEAELGYRPQYDLAAALAESARHLRAMPAA